MNDSTQQATTPEAKKGSEAERTQQVRVVGWVAGLSAFFAGITLTESPTWPVAFGIAAVGAMVTIICCFILRRG
jgi:hypothetical protein